MLDALRVKDFRLLWFGRAASQLGTWLLVVAVPAHVLELTGSVVAAGLTLAAEFLAPLVLGPVAGVVVDRWDRRRVMVCADLLRAVAIAALLFADGPGEVWLVYLALVVESVGSVAFRPAAQAHTPAVVGTGTLLAGANAVNAATDGTVRLVGAPLGGVLLALAGFAPLVWLDVVSYLVSAAAIVATSRRGAPGRSGGGLADLREGWAFLRRTPIPRALLLVNTVFLGANATLSSLVVPFGVQVLGGTGETGVVLSGLGVGFLLGAPATRLLTDRLHPAHLLAGALAVTAAGFGLLFSATSVPYAVAAAVVVGLAGSTTLVGTQTVLQRATPNAILGRVGAALFMGEAAASFAGALAGPALLGISWSAAVWTACGVTLLCAALALVMLRKAGRTTPPTDTPTPRPGQQSAPGPSATG
ncbi:MFS transporter [Actinosynnema sp. NPDC047251]|uniref:Permease, MFS-type n=1 Tax=Saccharothrix espanaensis (strain ATCC 51144 / DSM 44229 / JCM 9112 / NBRC 15066 / NRRL 15764) TaxID=1179773 RepID=K0JUV8_SACES|nr:MFS transporter [Saccharothrix espanaensis]CCH31615.1 Permease, MFS-type [Saccharothrix espanaensis DSM 44229]